MSDKIYTSDGMCQGCGQPVRRYISRGKSLVIYYCNGEHPDAVSHCGSRITFGRKVSDAILSRDLPQDEKETDHDPDPEEENHEASTPESHEEDPGEDDSGPDSDGDAGTGDEEAGTIAESDEVGRTEEATGGGAGGGAAEERGGMDGRTSLYERRRQRRVAGK